MRSTGSRYSLQLEAHCLQGPNYAPINTNPCVCTSSMMNEVWTLNRGDIKICQPLCKPTLFEQEYQQKESFNDVMVSLCRCCISSFDIYSTSCWSMSACYSSCFNQHKKHPKKLSNTSVKDKALGFQLHQQPRQLLSVFLVLAKLFMALHSKSFSEIGVCPCPCIPKNPRPWHVAETHTTMGIITMHTLTSLTKIQHNIK